MNTTQIIKIMDNISRDYAGMGRAENSLDNIIKDEIIRLYNNLPIDWEEVKFLWIDWLENENRWVRTYKKDQISSIMWRCYKKHKEKYDKINYENMMKHDRRHKGGGGGTRIFNGSITDYECRKDPFHDFRRCWN